MPNIGKNIFERLRKIFGVDKSEIAAILEKVPIFSDLNLVELNKIEIITHEREYMDGEQVFHENEPGAGMYIIRAGSIKLFKKTETGEIELPSMKQGDFFGEISLLDESNRSATAVAVGKTRILGFYRPDFLELLKRDPRLGLKVLLQLSQIIAKLFGIYFVILVALVIFYMAQDLLTPFLVAFILVYALNPLADKIESWGIKRPWAVAMIFIGFVVVSGLVVSLGFESIKAEITLLKTQVPAYIERIKLSLIDNAAVIEAKIPNMKKGILQNMITQKIGDLPTIIGEKMPYILRTLLGLVTSTLIVLFLTFFILKDGREFRKNIIRIVPNKYFETVLCLLFEINKSVGNYVRGQLIDCTIVAVLSVIGLSLIGLKYAIIIGIICGITNIIPYLGPIMGMIPAIFIALVEHKSGAMAGSVVAVMMGVQLIDNVAVSPIAVGQSVDLHPIIVILSVTIGGALMGLWGMLLAVPIYCALKVTFQILYKGIIEYGSWEKA